MAYYKTTALRGAASKPSGDVSGAPFVRGDELQRGRAV